VVLIGLKDLAIMSQPVVAHVKFGWFNLAWPNIAAWVAVVAAFFLFAWVRIPRAMEADAESRRKG
jgi:hypothetical protein